MCILFVAIEQHKTYPLIIAANRDEYYARPSKSMHFWEDHPGILAGRDLEAGGTWLGVNRDRQFAAVTNFRDPSAQRSDASSRGELVTEFLDQDLQHRPVSAFSSHLQQQHQHYNPFNLVFGNARQLHAWSHRRKAIRSLNPGMHSISNGPIEESWPKMSRGVKYLSDYIKNTESLVSEKILEMMQDPTKASTIQLPSTGLNIEQERALSSIYIHGDGYGTRTTTLLLFSEQSVELTEWNYTESGELLTPDYFKIT